MRACGMYMCVFILCRPWKACDCKFKYVKNAMELEEGASASSSGGQCSIQFKRLKPGMNYCAKPKCVQMKETVELQCGGVQCAFEVMVYQLT